MNLIFFGPPGAGKGTYAGKVAPEFEILHISTGDLFRAAIKAGTEMGLKAQEYMNKGELVPDEVTINMLQNRIKEDDCQKGFILDGFPRTIPQADALDASGIKIDKVINFNVEEETVLSRLGGRRTCKKCAAVFHTVNMPPKEEGVCDHCGGELFIREDQAPETIKERLNIYKEKTEPLVGYYKEKGILVDVDANSEVSTILPQFTQLLKDLQNS